MAKPDLILKQNFPRGEAHSMDPLAFDEQLRSQGVKFVHHRAMGCPVGIVNLDDTNRRIHEDHPGCSNGYLYETMGEITGSFINNPNNPDFQDPGYIDGSTVTVTFPHTYDLSGETIYVAPFDRFFYADHNVLWPHWEQVEASPSGRDRLRWPAEQVQNLVDSRMVRYKVGVDFDVLDGYVIWRPDGKRPGHDPETGRGRIFVCWYLYRPFWYVERLLHEGRVIQTENEQGIRETRRMPFHVSMVRERFFEDRQANDNAANGRDPRDMRTNRDGSFPPG